MKGAVALVTGGSRGIGRAVVRMLAKEGYHVSFNYFHNKESAVELEEEIKAYGVSVQAFYVDIRDFNAVKEWIDQTKKNFGQLDVLINNAGILNNKALMLMAPDDWKNVIDTNLNGMFNATRLCIVGFLKQKKGQVINVSSVAGLVGLARQTNYSASKGGMIAFTKALAKEVAAYGIRVNAIAPGYVETDMLSELSDKQREELLKTIPLRRMGSVGDITGTVKFLLSKEGQYITGQVIQIDGGLAIR